jgi:probable rRNA maturation factor
MSYRIAIQNTQLKNNTIPKPAEIQAWADCALRKHIDSAEVCIRIVDAVEGKQLNGHYRQKRYATNVLSFPSKIPKGIKLEKPFLGDIVLCAPVIEKEAQEQHKQLAAHWAHLVIHGILHLLGYDHVIPQEAEIMENEEIVLLEKLNYPNPYKEIIE